MVAFWCQRRILLIVQRAGGAGGNGFRGAAFEDPPGGPARFAEGNNLREEARGPKSSSVVGRKMLARSSVVARSQMRPSAGIQNPAWSCSFLIGADRIANPGVVHSESPANLRDA